jgi:hypothetical protein
VAGVNLTDDPTAFCGATNRVATAHEGLFDVTCKIPID